MEVRLYYSIDKQAAITAGRSVWGTQCLEVDPADVPEDVRALVAEVADVERGAPTTEAEIGLAEYYQLLRERAEGERRKREEKERERRTDRERYEAAVLALGDLDDDAIRRVLYGGDRRSAATYVRIEGRWPNPQISEVTRISPDLGRRLTEIEEERHRLREAAEREAAEQEERREQEERDRQERREQARAEILEAAVATCDDDTVAPRHSAGLLPEGEKSALISGALLEADLPRYQRLRPSDVPHSDECCHEDPTYATDDATDLDAGAWRDYRAVAEAYQAPLRIADLEVIYLIAPREHTATCDGCDGPTLSRFSARVSARVDGIEIASREYGIGADRYEEDE